MEQRIDETLSPYRIFSRAEWAAKRADTPMTLTPEEVTRLRSMHDRLDMLKQMSGAGAKRGSRVKASPATRIKSRSLRSMRPSCAVGEPNPAGQGTINANTLLNR